MNQASFSQRTDDRTRRSRDRRGARCGYTLVEMMVVVTISSLLLTSVGVALHSLFRVDQQLRQYVIQSMSMTRISLTLRGDAHEANSATTNQTPEGPSSLVLAYSDGRTITYAAEKARIVRLVKQGDDIQHREVYQFAAKATLSWRTEDVESKTLVVLEVVDQAGAIAGAADAKRVQRIEAVASLDLDYTKSEP